MRASVLVALGSALVFASGCSLAIDGDRFRGVTADRDAGDAAPRDGGDDLRDSGLTPRDGGDEAGDGGVLDGGERDGGAARDAGDGGPERDAGALRDGGEDTPRDGGEDPRDGGGEEPRDGGEDPRDGGINTPRDGGDAPPRDGGTPTPRDGGAVDAGQVDAGFRDGGLRDGGVPQITQIVFGSGMLEDGARGVPVWITGVLLPPGGSVVVSDPTIDVLTSAVNAAGTRAAAVLDVGVDTTLDEGDTRAIAISVANGAAQATQTTLLIGRDELDVTSMTTLANPRARYARIDVAAGAVLTVTTNGPAVLDANGPVTIDGTVRVDGHTNRTAGPAGCQGGGTRQAAPCPPKGGAEGRAGVAGLLAASGGAGGANRTAGGDGGGGFASGGTPATNVNAFLIPLSAHGGGGGGGGQGSTGAGGGGVLELRARSTLSLTGTLSAQGGVGVDLVTGLGCVAAATAGGGGAGGAILLRARDATFTGTIDVTGGAGGLGYSCADGVGGDGGDGFVRIDAPTVAGLMVTPAVFTRAPAWAEATQVLLPVGAATFTVVGAAGLTFEYALDNGGRTQAAIPGSGTVDIGVSVAEGLHTLCLYTRLGATEPEAVTCRDLVAL
ncbi:MAG: hypothetical protein RMA76_32115 [Deltaproteobacteria bacterium]